VFEDGDPERVEEQPVELVEDGILGIGGDRGTVFI
jgi:hypothetical protein